MRVLELGRRPTAIDELQAASAIGQGSLFRAYEERLAKGEVRAAQVLLTASDLQLRTNYLNARQTLSRLLDWRVVPVVNENDTTATDEITFGDNDFLAAQVAIMLEARLLVLPTDQSGLYTKDPRRHEDAELVSEVTSESPARRVRDRRAHTRRSGWAGCAARSRRREWLALPASAPRSATAPPKGHCWRLRRASRRHALHATPRAGVELQALAPLREAEPRLPASRRRRSRVPAREREQPAARRDHRGRGGSFDAGDAVDVTSDGKPIGKGIVQLLGRRAAPDQGASDREGPRAPAARLRGGGAPRLLCADLSTGQPASRVRIDGSRRGSHHRAQRCAAGDPYRGLRHGRALAAAVIATPRGSGDARPAISGGRRRRRGAHLRDPR